MTSDVDLLVAMSRLPVDVLLRAAHPPVPIHRVQAQPVRGIAASAAGDGAFAAWFASARPAGYGGSGVASHRRHRRASGCPALAGAGYRRSALAGVVGRVRPSGADCARGPLAPKDRERAGPDGKPATIRSPEEGSAEEEVSESTASASRPYAEPSAPDGPTYGMEEPSDLGADIVVWPGFALSARAVGAARAERGFAGAGRRRVTHRAQQRFAVAVAHRSPGRRGRNGEPVNR